MQRMHHAPKMPNLLYIDPFSTFQAGMHHQPGMAGGSSQAIGKSFI
jgi:hypothetical protein